MQKVAVLMKHKKNSQLLVDFLSRNYKVVQCNKSDLFENSFDLVILDDFMLTEISTYLELIKERQVPIFLPFLLITTYKGINIIKENPLCKKVDDFVKVPIDKSELAYRVNSLLTARKLSLESDRRYYTLAESLPLGVCIIQNEQFIYANSKLTKKIANGKIVGTPYLDYIYPEDQAKAIEYCQELYNEPEKNISRNLRIKDAGTMWINFHAKKINHNEKPALLIIIMDITEKIKNDAHVKYLSYHDKLTGIYNRTFFTKELERLEKANLLPLTVIMGDVNNLKLVNDAFGHLEGDKLIKKVADIIQECCRTNDIVVRWGGDEFVIILPLTESTGAAKVCKRIKEACDKAEGIQIKISIALGYATKETNEQSVEETLQEADNRMYRNKLTENASERHTVIDSLIKTLKEKSFETEEHTMRLQILAFDIGKELRLSDDKLDELSLLATLHDIGKVAIPEEILLKPGKLNQDEWKKIKEHPEIGYRIVKSIPALAHVAEAILSHHERWDGNGYPQGLKGDCIPIISRIIAIVDAYDVMTHKRAYKEAISQDDALQEIKKCAGSHFDPELANHFCEMFLNKV